MEQWEILNYAMNKIDKVFEEARNMTPTEKIAATTRDNFDPAFILTGIRQAEITYSTAMRLLGEACHVIARQNTQLGNARRIAAEIHGVLEVNK